MNAATAFDDACKSGDAALAAKLVQEGSGMDCVLDAVREALRTERAELIQALAPHLPHYPTTMHLEFPLSHSLPVPDGHCLR